MFVFRLIKRLCDHSISQVMCGNQHCIALSRGGKLNSQMYFNHIKNKIFYYVLIPKALVFPSSISVCDSCLDVCIDETRVFPSSDGQLFTWGQNTNGQLGLGKGEPSKLSPHPLKSLAGIPLAQITAGGDHSFALSLSGAVFGWGKNRAGQLGLNDKQDRAVPCHIKFLRSQKVVYISCGDEHTAALTKDGGLFTFGDSSWGQLGHGSTNNELLPRRVLELMGTEVSQIACGRHHTLALVASSCMVYAFGCNSHGQLGTGILVMSKLPPCDVHKMRLSGSYFTEKTTIVKFVARILKVNVLLCLRWSFLLSPQSSAVTEDFRVTNVSRSLSPINFEQLNSWRLKMMYNTDSIIVSWFPRFMSSPLASKSFESLLIPQLPRSPPDVEAMRIYLILSEYPALQDSKNYIRLTIPLAMAILRLDANPSKVLDNWWCLMDDGFFTRMVDMYKSIVVFMLTGGKTVLVPVFYDNYFLATLRLLEKLHKVNLKANHVEYSRFYIPDITSLVDIQEDYLKWFLSKKMGSSPSQNDFPSVNLCAFPFILNAQAKTTMLQTDAELQMQVTAAEGRLIRASLWQRSQGGANVLNQPEQPDLIFTSLKVMFFRNQNLVYDKKNKIKISFNLCSLQVIFDGEEAVDAGGVTKEFFLLLLKELLDPVYGMFTHYKDSNLLWFSDKCFVEQNWFHLIGIICGLAIYNSTVVDLHFPLALYKKLLDVPPSLEDFKELSPTEARSLQQLLDYDGGDVEDTFLLNFAITRENYGMTEIKELVPGGESIAVDKNNRKEFVEAYLRYVFSDSVCEQYSAFSAGFLKVCGGEILSLFQPSELMAMVVGNSNYNWEEMEKNAVYKGEYTAAHPTVRFFWEVFHEFPLEKKKQFLLFLTGSDRIPIHGMESLRIVIQSTTAEEHYLPVAHTCYNLLDMPRYQTKEILRRRLTQAVEQYEGFSLV
uniref:HECT and RLD domain containing E3 ubiquitin protein ligase 3 n=1 Tax=Fundulus heteroclitus TaxID=8078 RepID=A0A3Q2P0V4_FUNHE